MREFFKPWRTIEHQSMKNDMCAFFEGRRRKIGIATLVLACVFMSVWLRSTYRSYCLWIPRFPKLHVVAILPRGLAWASDEEIMGAKNTIQYKLDCGSFGNSPAEFVSPPDTGLQDGWRWYWCGFFFEEGQLPVPTGGRLHKTIWVFPYWSIVTPLTLLSAWLLLSKQRAKTKHIEST